MNVLRLLCDAEYYHDMEWKKSHVFFYHHKPATFTGDYCTMPGKKFGSPFGHRRSQCILLWAMPESLTGSTKPTEGRIAQPMVALINSTLADGLHQLYGDTTFENPMVSINGHFGCTSSAHSRV
ncbi:hypothetical protein PROFUN_03580 [Planoprotostelium fungivorum]|uniref:Uncharacterized protein n=1 Tax=Planoprotostelium fungivorum TaxID=1890364 RepID=A0A2P6MSI2_9EUKA|nr:hypothetical protein PROFUN_03580 [Planoprotostelium fungivorum]